MKLLYILSLLTLLVATSSKYSYFLEQIIPMPFYKCIKPSFSTKITLLLPYSKDQVDPNYLQNIQKVAAFGMEIQLVINPYRCRSAEEDFRFLSENLGPGVSNKFWMTFQDDQTCSWGDFSATENCQYVQNLIKIWKAENVDVSIVANADDWDRVFKNRTACRELSSSQLWWAETTPYIQIGGWRSPSLSLVSRDNICGENVVVSQSQ